MKDVMYTVAKQQVCFNHVAKTMDIVNHPKMGMVSLYHRKKHGESDWGMVNMALFYLDLQGGAP